MGQLLSKYSLTLVQISQQLAQKSYAALNEHVDNLLMPRGVNGAKMQPIGKLPVKLELGDKNTVMIFISTQIYSRCSNIMEGL